MIRYVKIGLKMLIGVFLYKLGRGYYRVSDQMYRLNIKKDDIVLEVGSGFSPGFRSDILLEKFLSDTQERKKEAIIDERPFINADAANLPFLNNSIDYIYSTHVLEHVPNPEKVLDEFKRVCSKGYIETPSELWEKLHPGLYHKWYVSVVDNALIFKKKERTIFDDYLAKRFSQLQKNRDYRKFRYKSDDYYLVQFEWGNNEKFLNYRVIGKNMAISKNGFLWANVDEVFDIKKYKRKLHFFKRIIRRFYKSQPVDIYKILACPLCKNKIYKQSNFLICNNCKKKYPIIDNVPILLKEKSIDIK